EEYGKAVRDNADKTILNVDELVDDIKNATRLRNVLCHGSWQSPDAAGKSLPLYMNKNIEIFETSIDIDFLRKVQCHVVGLACTVINSVTHMGWQFPGGAGPGKAIWHTEGDG
ncbi:MAG: hypothetical protein Q8S17_00675, partial [Humidesulfovibrio sp.]|nr:hypothetical protein [Humidesulfovibrio sp.]